HPANLDTVVSSTAVFPSVTLLIDLSDSRTFSSEGLLNSFPIYGIENGIIIGALITKPSWKEKGNYLLLGWSISCVIADRFLVPSSIQPG
ncbi:MAG: hypothetical protein SO169_00175, partial [Parabacteroides sp.]|nr:hypothetical protein [Parabacteroides sp.]